VEIKLRVLEGHMEARQVAGLTVIAATIKLVFSFIKPIFTYIPN
jgi:hypothetical protein